MVVATPSDENETRLLLSTCYRHSGPASVRYPRGAGCGATVHEGLDEVELGKGVVRRQGKNIAILAFGTLATAAQPAAQAPDATVVDMRFVKPLAETLPQHLSDTPQALFPHDEQ